MTLLALKAFFSKNGMLVAIIAAGLAMFWSYDRSRVNHGRELGSEEARRGTITAGKINARKTEAARARAERLSYRPDGLRDSYFRD
jgi:hypothetical protein